MRAGLPYMVGERRRELFVPNFNGAIIPQVARPVTVAPVPLRAPRSRRAAPPVNVHAPVTINVGSGADAMEISRQVQLAFIDIQREIESAHRVLLND